MSVARLQLDTCITRAVLILITSPPVGTQLRCRRISVQNRIEKVFCGG